MKSMVAYKQDAQWVVSFDNKQGNQTKPLPPSVESGADVVKYVSERMNDKYFIEFAQSDIPVALKSIRDGRGISQIKAANEIGVSLATVASVEQGKIPGDEVALKINKWLNK